jgi:hypothetical protein
MTPGVRGSMAIVLSTDAEARPPSDSDGTDVETFPVAVAGWATALRGRTANESRRSRSVTAVDESWDVRVRLLQLYKADLTVTMFGRQAVRESAQHRVIADRSEAGLKTRVLENAISLPALELGARKG